MAMTIEEIKAQLKKTYEGIDNIHGIADAKQAVRDTLKTAFYLADQVEEQQAKNKEQQAQIDALQEKGKGTQ
jgi:hypothetical protein